MAIAFYGSQISDHMAKTPEGYLICYAVPINRTGQQVYMARELGLEGDPDRAVNVYRLPEDVFAESALASFEGKDVTATHPPDNLTAETQAAYSKGHMENVRRVGDNTVADLLIKDPALISDVENGIMREISCGYVCTWVPYKDGYKQTNIIGNHVAVVPKGRAGSTVAIKDAAAEAEKGRQIMSDFWKSVLTAFGMAAKDASPEELDAMVATTAKALDAVPAEKAQEAEPAKAEPAKEEKPMNDEMIEKAPKGDDIGSKLDRILEMLEAKSRGGRGEKPLHDEEDLDEMIEKLTGKEEKEDPEAAVTVPAEKMEDACGKSMDSAAFLRRVRPAVAAIKDPKEKARVVDALLGTVKGDTMGAILSAAKDSASKAADASRRTSYEVACSESQAAYAAMNPHIKKEG